jgi:alpha-beta hydrolase superfamily lysophospholipase
MAGMAGAGAGGALGWIAGLVAGLRGTQYVARRYAGRIRRGGILMSVHCDSPEWCTRAKKALLDTGGRSISSSPEAAADYGTTDKPTERAPVSTPVSMPVAVIEDEAASRPPVVVVTSPNRNV